MGRSSTTVDAPSSTVSIGATGVATFSHGISRKRPCLVPSSRVKPCQVPPRHATPSRAVKSSTAERRPQAAARSSVTFSTLNFP